MPEELSIFLHHSDRVYPPNLRVDKLYVIINVMRVKKKKKPFFKKDKEYRVCFCLFRDTRDVFRSTLTQSVINCTDKIECLLRERYNIIYISSTFIRKYICIDFKDK